MIQKVKAIYPKVNRLESKIEYVNFDSVYRTFLKYISSYRAYPFLYFRFLLIILIKFIKYSDSPVILPLKKNEVEEITSFMKKALPFINQKSIKSTAEFFSLLSVLDSAVHKVRKDDSLHSPESTKSQKTVNDIITYINNHLEENITIPEISAHFFLNKDYLSRLFTKHAHTSIGHYISIQRIAKAQEYLRLGMTVSEVIKKMGFSSYAYFFKAFQKMTGISPSKYRGSLQKNQKPL